ncbi:MAG: aldo/keto reductase [Candidatus Hodarchaeota archaeon]
MKYRTLGRTGLEVSEIGLGTEYLFRQPKDVVISVIHEAIRNGINYFDIVFNVSEYINNISSAIKDYKDEIILTCHLGTIEEDGKIRRTRNIKDCERTFLNTLSRFGKGYIDIINLQFVKEREYESIIAPGGLLDLAKKLRKDKKARFIGLSTHNISIGQKAVKSGYFDIIMNQINVVNHNMPGREDFLQICSKEGIGLVAIKPFAGGKLLQRNRTVSIAKYQSGGISIKKKIPKDINPIKCLNYTLSQTGVSTTIPGIKNLQELKEALALLNASEEEKDYSPLIKEFESIY